MKYKYFWLELVQHLNSAKTIPKMEYKILFVWAMWMLKMGMNYFLIFSYWNNKILNSRAKIVANQLNNMWTNLPRKTKILNNRVHWVFSVGL